MAPSLTVDVFQSPAVGILCDLERDGFSIELTVDGVLVIAPKSRLTADRMQIIAGCKDALKMLLRCCDDGVAARRDAFRQQFDAAPTGTLAALLLRPDVPCLAGRCFSCGDGLRELRFGRCWRCSLAWRLACRLPVPADLAAALDAARVT